MKLKPYPKYKPSGVECLGDVPSHWQVKRLKRDLAILTNRTERKSNPVGLENIEGWSGRFVETDTEFEGEGVAFEAGDILFGKLRPYLAKVFLAPSSGEAVGDFHVLRPSASVHGKYAKFAMLTKEFISIVDGSTFGAKMPRVGWDFMGFLFWCLPPDIEQSAIAAFLDRETAKIDTLITKQETLIELLREKRQAVISHAVTKGLNPNVPMKPSGVEWLGHVPEHWDITRLGWIASEINDINHEMPVAVDVGVPFLSAKDLLNDGTLNFEVDIKQISEEDFSRLSAKIRPRRNDIIYSRIGARLGKARLVETDVRFLVSYSCCVIRMQDGSTVLPEYICALLDTDLVLTEAKARTNGIGVPDLGLGEIARYPIPLPPTEEQHEIDCFLRHQCSNIDMLIAKAQQAIELQKEHRTALISAAVSGKIDVRGLIEQDVAEEKAA